MTATSPTAAYHQYVVFMDAPQKPYLKLLKRGFRHCAYVVRHNEEWIIYDPLSRHTDLMISTDADLITRFEKAGFSCVPVQSRQPVTRGIIIPEIISCVTQIKRILGVRNICIQTPYQFYKFLQKDQT